MTTLRNLLIAFALLWAMLSSAPIWAANRFLTCPTTCTITAIDTTIWGAASGGVGASVPGTGDAVILDTATCVGGVTCTATMGSGYNPTWQSVALGTCTASTTGCVFDASVNNNNITLTSNGCFNGSGTGTRTILAGSGTWTCSAVNAAWTMTTTTNLSNPTTAFSALSIVMSGAATTVNTFATGAGGVVYGSVTFSANNNVNMAGSGITIGTFSITGPSQVSFPQGATTTVTNAFNWIGTSSNPILITNSNPNNGVATLTTGSGTTNSCTWCGFKSITFTPVGGSTLAATNSFNFSGNSGTGFTITPPIVGGGKIIGGSLMVPGNDNKVCDGFVGKLPYRVEWKKCA